MVVLGAHPQESKLVAIEKACSRIRTIKAETTRKYYEEEQDIFYGKTYLTYQFKATNLLKKLSKMHEAILNSDENIYLS